MFYLHLSKFEEDFVKKFICCFFAAFIAATAWTQEPLVPKSDFSAVARAGQSELIFENKARDPILVSINGARAAHLFPGEITKIIVNNGSVSIEAQTYTFNNKRGWRAEGKAAWLIITPDSQSFKLLLNNNTHEDARIILSETKPLQTQNSGTQIPNVYSASGIDNAVKYGTEELLLRIPAKSMVAVVNIVSRDREMTEYIIGEVEYILVNNNLKIVDRRRLDTVMQEQKFQMTGDVDDKSAVSIGKLLGANIVITGSVSGSGTTRRLRLTAITVQTGEVVAMASERF